MIHVCSLARLHKTVEFTGARHLVTLLKDVELVQRPNTIAPDQHLILSMDDVTEPLDGFTAPADEHIAKLVSFVRGWDRANPMVIHCYAGISRSTAGAFIAACVLNPQRSEHEIAQEIRRASVTASPNMRIVSLADRMLGREGRMCAAVATIGRGEEAIEGHPFRLALE